MANDNQTALMMLIEHEQGVLERMSSGFVHIQQQEDRLDCLNKLLAVEESQMEEAWYVRPDSISGDFRKWFNEKYGTNGK